MASNLSLAFNLSASATGMAQGINAGVVELQKLGYAAKQTARDVSTLKTIEISKLFINSVQSIAGAFTRFTSGALSAVDNTRQLAQSLGVTYGELRTLQVAADLSGASSEQLATAFTRAQVTISKAAGGSKEAKAALDKLGLSVEGLATQTSTQQFSAIAQAINAIQNPAERAAAAVAIFGRSGAELLPTFRELPENLQTANTFLGQFRDGVQGVNPDAIDAIGDSFSLAGQAIQELAGRVLTQLAPALTKGADEFVKFIANIDVGAAAESARQGLQSVASVVGALAQFAAPLAKNLLPSIGAYLAFINRQAIGAGIAGLARAFAAAASTALGYSAAAGTAAASTATLGVAIRSLLASTGVGLLVVALGALGGAALEWGLSSGDAGDTAQGAIDGASDAAKRLQQEMANAGVAAFNMGEDVKKALKVPEQISIREFAQGGLDEARGAIVALAKELGGLNQVPAALLTDFQDIANFAGQITETVLDQGGALAIVDQRSKALIETVRKLTDTRKADADAAKQAAEAARKAAEDNRKRVEELAGQGLTGAEQSRLQLNKDLLAITQEQAAAEAALAAAMKNRDRDGILAAEERLRLAKEAIGVAKNQDRDRQLQALGIDQSLLKPAKTLKDEFLAIRQAFDKGLIKPGEAAQALRTLAAEGINIRQEIAAELRKPSQQALTIQDVRTNEGMAAVMQLATGRQDPAIEQRREQLKKLDEIKRAIVDTGANPVIFN